MTIRHHISDDLLVSYAAGSLAEGWSIAVATHLALCPSCRRRLSVAESIGGEMLETIVDDATLDDSWASVRRRLLGPVEQGVGGLARPPGIQPLEDVGGEEALHPNGDGEAGQRVELVLVQRR